jgi:DNA repair protein RadD
MNSAVPDQLTYTPCSLSYTLRPYQLEAVEATLKHFRKSRKPAVIVLPTGAGKSLVIAELAHIARGRVIVLTHVKELVEQNYAKFCSYGLEAGIYSAGLQRKNSKEKVIFGGIQSVARADNTLFKDCSLLIIDECHRISLEDGDTQYAKVIQAIFENNPKLCILGLTATPYRLGSGWIYQYHYKGALRSNKTILFQKCIYELSLKTMIESGYLTQPVQIDAPVASYDFSDLKIDVSTDRYSLKEIESVLKSQERITPVIVQNIIELSKTRRGVLIFTASVRHAEEILTLLPGTEAALVVGETESAERSAILSRFKARSIKYLVNVSVLTTGFDAPHVDVIAILRPTESISLYQQIVGRGLRLFQGKEDCLILDYTGVPHDIFAPQIQDHRPAKEAIPVKIECPMCQHENDFWGVKNSVGEVVEHFGLKCTGALEDIHSGAIIPCGYRYRFKHCDQCGAENDLNAERCHSCRYTFIDDDAKLKEYMSQKDVHIMAPDSMHFRKVTDSKGSERLEIRYYDLDGKYLSEVFFFNSPESHKVFYYNFQRMHFKTPGIKLIVKTTDDALKHEHRFRLPLYVIARKQGKFWKIREKIF